MRPLTVFAFSLWLIAGFGWQAAIAQQTTQKPKKGAADTSKSKQRLIALVEKETQAGRFSGAVLVARDNKILLSGGYGLANREHKVRNTADTKFRVGSITKQFTAMAILILEKRGKLDVEKPISTYLPDSPPAWKSVTVHHLLTHTSGIPSFTGFPEYRKRMSRPSTVTQTIELFKDKKLEFEPGTKFHYNNSGYVLLGATIEKLSGVTYANFVKKNIFAPLKMNDSLSDQTEQVIQNRASGYSRRLLAVRNADYIHMSVPHAAGALLSTVNDLFRWDQALNSKKLLSAAAYKKMYTPALKGYAYGWVTRSQLDRKCISHGGGINGFRSQILRFPDDRVFVVVLSNLDYSRAPSLAGKLAKLVLEKKQ